MIKSKYSNIQEIYPVLAFEKNNFLFYISDGKKSSLGFSFLLEPLTYIDNSIANRLNVLLNYDYPSDSVVQYSLISSNFISDRLISLRHTLLQQNQNSLQEQMIKNKIEFLLKGANSVINGCSSLIRDFNVLVTVNIPIKKIEPSIKEIENIGELRLAVQNMIETIGFNKIDLDANLFINILYPFFNKNRIQSYDSDKPIAKQLLDFDNKLVCFEDHLEIGANIVRSYSVKRYPDHLFLGDALKYSVDILTGNRGIHIPFIITGNVYYEDCKKLKSKFQTKRQWLLNQAYGPLLKFLPKLAVRKHGFDVLGAEVENGQKLLKFNFTISTFAKNEIESISSGTELCTYYKENGFDILPDKYFTLPIFLNSLPFGCDIDVFNSLMRFKTLCPKIITPLLPILSEAKGGMYGELNLISRSGQLMDISIFNGTSNYNLCVAAQSGSGKSFLINELISTYLLKGAKIYVIDIGKSYQKLTRLLGGSFIEYENFEKINFNPFENVKDLKEDGDMIHGILLAMISVNEKLSSFQNAELRRITNELFNQYGNNLSIDILAEQLIKDKDTRISDMGKQLFVFTSRGTYGSFFNKSSKKNIFENNLVVLELEGFKGRKHLQQIVLLELIYKIQQDMFLGDRSQEKLLVIDEAWDLLRDGEFAGFIENGYRRFRKYKASAITITQSINDLYCSKVGIAILENSANMFLLGQKPETISYLQKENKLALSDGEYQLLKSVHTIPNIYSEIFIITDYMHAIGRLVVDDFRKILYSTKSDDVYAINNLLSQGYSVKEAIDMLLNIKKNKKQEKN
ncbi:MAG: type IV secretion system protein TraC [Succinivibrionaceae bacterium]